MIDEDYQKFKESFRIILETKLYSIFEESGRYWNELRNFNYDFEVRKKLVSILNDTIKQEVIEYFEGIFI